jgi:predicted aspartyl protease
MTNDKEPGWTKIRIRQSVDDLFKRGPTINIGIAPQPFLGRGLMTVLAQIDTGAAGTALSPRLANKLGLEPAGRGKIIEAGREPIVVPYFKVRLFLPGMDIETKVSGLSLPPPHDILIGRDILANCRIAIDFITGAVCLHIKNPQASS